MTLTDIRDPILRRENERLRKTLGNLLRSPYEGQPSIAMAITAACVELKHEVLRTSGSCICGQVTP